MIRSLHAPIGQEVDLGWVRLSPDLIRRYHAAMFGHDGGNTADLPLGLALTLRGGPRPTVEPDANTVSVHAGHALQVHAALALGAHYRVRGRIATVCEKTGRSGLLTVITRTASLRDVRGDLAVEVEDQQIVRRIGTSPAQAPDERPSSPIDRPPMPLPPQIDIGVMIGVEHRMAPDPSMVRQYATLLAEREPMFLDSTAAQGLGFAGVIVPGPMQAALMERMLRSRLAEWRLVQMSFSFRISVYAGEAIEMSGLVTDRATAQGIERLALDVWIDNANGERAAVGSARLLRDLKAQS